MKIVDFADLCVSDQIDLLYQDGIYLSKRKQGFTPIILYQFENLYVGNLLFPLPLQSN